MKATHAGVTSTGVAPSRGPQYAPSLGAADGLVQVQKCIAELLNHPLMEDNGDPLVRLEATSGKHLRLGLSCPWPGISAKGVQCASASAVPRLI